MTTDTVRNGEVDLVIALAPHLQKAVDDVAAAQGFTNPRFEVTQASAAGDNYIGVLYRVIVTEQEQGERRLSLIVKSVPASAMRREMCGTERIFRNEGSMYSTVLPTFARMLQDKGLSTKDKHRDCYPDAPRSYLVSVGQSSGEEDLLVLQDMASLGYTMYNRLQGVDEERCRMVLAALARLHACSLAMQHLEPERLHKLQQSISEVLFYSDSPMRDFMGPLSMRAYDMIKERYPEGSPGYQKVKCYLDDLLEKLIVDVSPHPDGGNVICHGDCWTNNMLFKRRMDSDEPIIESVCMIDFQVARFCPPVVDLLYFLYTCTEKEMRDKHLDGLLRGYHAELQTRMCELGVKDPDVVYSWDRLQGDLRERGRFAFATALFAIPIFLTEKDEAIDMDAIFDESGTDTEALFEKFKPGQKRADTINKRVSDVLQDVIEKGYL